MTLENRLRELVAELRVTSKNGFADPCGLAARWLAFDEIADRIEVLLAEETAQPDKSQCNWHGVPWKATIQASGLAEEIVIRLVDDCTSLLKQKRARERLFRILMGHNEENEDCTFSWLDEKLRDLLTTWLATPAPAAERELAPLWLWSGRPHNCKCGHAKDQHVDGDETCYVCTCEEFVKATPAPAAERKLAPSWSGRPAAEKEEG